MSDGSGAAASFPHDATEFDDYEEYENTVTAARKNNQYISEMADAIRAQRLYEIAGDLGKFFKDVYVDSRWKPGDHAFAKLLNDWFDNRKKELARERAAKLLQVAHDIADTEKKQRKYYESVRGMPFRARDVTPVTVGRMPTPEEIGEYDTGADPELLAALRDIEQLERQGNGGEGGDGGDGLTDEERRLIRQQEEEARREPQNVLEPEDEAYQRMLREAIAASLANEDPKPAPIPAPAPAPEPAIDVDSDLALAIRLSMEQNNKANAPAPNANPPHMPGVRPNSARNKKCPNLVWCGPHLRFR